MKKILHIGFGYEPFWHGGMVMYQMDLMQELSAFDYDIILYTAGRYDLRRKPYLLYRKLKGIKTVELVNSPNLYDPYCYRSHPESHCRHKLVEEMTRKIVETEVPSLIHLHDLRMHCASVIRIAKDFKIPIIKTIHNFWDLCPKDDLLYKDSETCNDFNNGEKCLKCLEIYPVRKMPSSTRVKGTVNSQFLVSRIEPLWKFAGKVRPKNQTLINFAPMKFHAQSYKERRRYFLNMLNLCDAIHVTSNHCAFMLAKFGIKRPKLRVIPLSVRLLSKIKAKPDYSPHYPIVFGYRGLIHHRKGIHILLSAFAQLDQSKCKLVIMGQGDTALINKYSNKKVNIEFRGHYQPNEIQASMKDIDVGVVPSIWEEPFGVVGLEYLNARIPVIASNIGGITEWLHDGINGFLCEPGDVVDLRRTMHKFVDGPKLVGDMQSRIEPWKTMNKHAREIDSLYKLILSKK